MSDFSEVTDFAAELTGAGDRLMDAVRPVMAASGAQMASYQREHAPVRTGETRATISYEVDPDGLGVTSGTESFQAPELEGGTPRHGPQPFIFPALDHVEEAHTEALAEAAAKAIFE